MSKIGKFQTAKPVKTKKGGFWRGLLTFFISLVLFLLLVAVALYLLIMYCQPFREFVTDSAVGAVVGKLYGEGGINVVGFDNNKVSTIDDKDTGIMEETIPTAPSEAIETTETTQATEPTTEPPTEPTTEETEPDWGETGKVVNILVIGQAARDAVESSKLADTIMLFTLNKETKTLTVTSFLRDGYVKLADYRTHTCGWNRVNVAYALGYGWYGDAGAMEMLNITLAQNYGVKVDGDVEVSFEAFVQVIDILGGIDIELSGDELAYMNEIARRQYGYTFVEGVNHLDGGAALEYARMRHASPADSDVRRTTRQRGMIEEVLRMLRQQDLSTLLEIVDVVLPLISTNIEREDMKVYITELLPYIFDITMTSNQCPAEGTYYGEMKDLPDGPSGVLVVWNVNKNKEIMGAICSGEDPFAGQ